MKSTSKFFCKAPFTEMSIDPRGEILPCCRYEGTLSALKDERIDKAWNNKNYKDLRTRFLNGEKPKECIDCWNAEESGNVSLRQSINLMAQDIDFDSNIVEKPPLYYEFKLSNRCNLKCRMCYASNSSSIAKETKINPLVILETTTPEERKHLLSNKIIGTHHEQIVFEWIKSAKHILFAGGEPFINKEIKIIIQYIEDQKLSKDIEVLLITNGTYWDDKFVSQLKNFKKLKFTISIDDIYERNDYQREMSDFNVIEENLIKFSSIFHKKIIFNCTINWYNIWEIEEFFKYADDINIPVSVQFVTAPVHLNIINLPIKIKKLINEKYKSSTDERIKLIVNRLNLPGKDLSFNFFNHVKHYDKLRNNSFTDVFSEWSRILLNEK